MGLLALAMTAAVSAAEAPRTPPHTRFAGSGSTELPDTARDAWRATVLVTTGRLGGHEG